MEGVEGKALQVKSSRGCGFRRGAGSLAASQRGHEKEPCGKEFRLGRETGAVKSWFQKLRLSPPWCFLNLSFQDYFILYIDSISKIVFLF